jgi:hypothetical protein
MASRFVVSSSATPSQGGAFLRIAMIDIEKLKKILGKSIIDGDTHVVVSAIIELAEKENDSMKNEAGAANPKWSPLDRGFIKFGGCTEKNEWLLETFRNYAHQEALIDCGLICKTEKDAIKKHDLLRSVSRLDSLVGEYGEYTFEKEKGNWFIYFNHNNQLFDVDKNYHVQLLNVSYHTEETVRDICKRLNYGEVEL